MSTVAEVERLAASTYIALTTYRKGGAPVPTTVWVASEGDRLYVWTQADSGKVARIRRDGRVSVAPCDSRGAPQGAAVEGSGRVMDSAEDLAHVQSLMRAKYGVQFRLFEAAGNIARRGRPRCGIEITLTPSPDPA
jgi:PPOX class probable F420-dependent enzyme